MRKVSVVILTALLLVISKNSFANSPPPTPSLVSPYYGQTNIDPIDAALSWTLNSDSDGDILTSYLLIHVAGTPWGTSPGTVSSTSYTAINLQPNTTYEWAVAAWDRGTHSNPSFTWSYTRKFVTGNISNQSITLFNSSGVLVANWLGDVGVTPQQKSYTDNAGQPHVYHLFTKIKDVDPSKFQLAIKLGSSGSVLSVSVPPGGDSTDPESGGALQVLIPLGLTVNRITGINANFEPTTDFFSCAKDALIEETISEVLPIASLSYQLSKCVSGGSSLIPAAGDMCDVAYPIITQASSDCLEQSNGLYGQKVLNTHQIRNVKWKPIGTLLPSTIRFYLAQSSDKVLSILKQQGITVYVNTPKGDYLLDNFH